MSNGKMQRKELKPLNVTCTSTDCDNDLHCFKKTQKMAEAQRGHCRACGADLIDWNRIHHRNPGDASYTFGALKYEKIRHHFWHKPIDQKATNHARRKGRLKLKEDAKKRLKKSIGMASPSFDGRQTGTEGNIIFYAQHALACCCRTCLEYWHGIPKNIELSDEQINYFVDLIMMYIDERMPNLTELGEKVPSIQRQKIKE